MDGEGRELGDDGATDGGASGIGGTEEDFATLVEVLFDEGVSAAVELFLGAIDEVNDGVVGEGHLPLCERFFATRSEGVGACQQNGTAMDDGVVEGVAHHHLSFEFHATHAQSVRGLTACLGTVEVLLPATEACVGSIRNARVGIEVKAALCLGVNHSGTFEPCEGIDH